MARLLRRLTHASRNFFIKLGNTKFQPLLAVSGVAAKMVGVETRGARANK